MHLVDKYTVQGDFPAMPGSALRNPAYSYENWGIEGGDLALRVASDSAYHKEWQEGTPKQMEYVIEAAETAGIGNCSNMLRELQCRTIHEILKLPRLARKKRIRYTEPGAGVSTVMVYKHLIDNGYDVDRIVSTLIEPSEKRLDAAVENLVELGLVEGNNFIPIVGKDSDIPFYLDRNSQDIIAANATLHHHAYQDRVFQVIHDALASRGIFANFDWFEGWCEHPARIYQTLMNHEFKDPVVWETKDADLDAYSSMFPNALNQTYLKFDPADEMAVRMIINFWLDGYAVSKAKAIKNDEFDPKDDILLHEAHGRPHLKAQLLKETGFSLETGEVRDIMESAEYIDNPTRVLTRDVMMSMEMDKLYGDIPEDGSNLLMGFLSQK